MKGIIPFLILMASIPASPIAAQDKFEQDIIKTAEGDLKITFIGHGSLFLKYRNINIHVDPYGRLADYSTLPKADLIFITHHHGDHLDPTVLDLIRRANTQTVLTPICAQQIANGIVMQNGDVQEIQGVRAEAIPAYNLVHTRDDGQPFHPRGEGNGYVLTFGNRRVLIAGDTENTPELNALKNIDYAFLPMNLPYTMTPEMVAQAARAFSPKVLYPYHYGETDPSRIIELLADREDIEVRIRKMQ